MGLRLHLSIMPTLSQFATAAGCPSTREQVTNEAGSDYRAVLEEASVSTQAICRLLVKSIRVVSGRLLVIIPEEMVGRFKVTPQRTLSQTRSSMRRMRVCELVLQLPLASPISRRRSVRLI